MSGKKLEIVELYDSYEIFNTVEGVKAAFQTAAFCSREVFTAKQLDTKIMALANEGKRDLVIEKGYKALKDALKK